LNFSTDELQGFWKEKAKEGDRKFVRELEDSWEVKVKRGVEKVCERGRLRDEKVYERERLKEGTRRSVKREG
jgi:hypothetical protein